MEKNKVIILCAVVMFVITACAPKVIFQDKHTNQFFIHFDEEHKDLNYMTGYHWDGNSLVIEFGE